MQPVLPLQFHDLIKEWVRLRGSDSELPARQQISPAHLGALLPHIIIMEKAAAEQVRIRQAGQTIMDRLGMLPLGMPVTALFEPEIRDALDRAIRQTLTMPGMLLAEVRGEPGLGQPKLEGRLLVLPMRGRQGHVDNAIGCLLVDGRPGATPRRLHLVSTRLLALPPARGAAFGQMAFEQAGEQAAELPEAAGFADAARAFRHAPPTAGIAAGTPIPGSPHLRLVKG